MRAEMLPEHMHEILTEMCKRVGADKETIDFKKRNWFLEYEWTFEEEDDFTKWLGKFLKKHRYVGAGKKRGVDWGYYEAVKIVGNYGWKTRI